jgi:putative ABC transporter-associated repeat protein
MRSRAGAALAAAALMMAAPAVALAQPSTTPAANEPTGTGRAVIADGHVDLGPRFLGGAWRLQIRDDTVRPVVWRNLPDVVLQAVDAAAVTVPADPAFAFLGQAGAQVWVLPQTQQPGILWPGWNTQDPSVIPKVNREATWRLHGVTGPGKFALFLNGNFGAPQILFDSAKSFPQETGIEVGSHVHGNWVFGAPGSYVLDTEMLASTVDGSAVTDRQQLRIFVGPGDPNTAFPAATSTPPTTTATSASTPAPPVAEAPGPAAAETRPAPWVALGAGGLAVLAAGAGVLMWLRRRQPRRGEES